MLIQATTMVCSMIFFWDSALPWSAWAKTVQLAHWRSIQFAEPDHDLQGKGTSLK
jgi:hypothetical protein